MVVREAGGVVFDLDGSEHGLASGATLASTRPLREPLLELVGKALAGVRLPS